MPYEYRDDGVASPGTPGSFTFRLNAGEEGSGFATNFDMQEGGTSNVASRFNVSMQTLAIDSQSNMYIGGTFTGVLSLGTLQLRCPAASQGAFIMVTEVQIDSQENVLIAGMFVGTTTFNNGGTSHDHPTDENAFALKLNGFTGQNIWGDAYVVTAPSGRVLLKDATLMRPVEGEHLLLAGGFLGSVNFGGGVRTSTPVTGWDGFITRINTTNGTYITDRIINDSAVFGSPGEQLVFALDVDTAGVTHFVGAYTREVDWCNGGSPCGGSPYTAPISRLHMFLGQINVLGTPTLGRDYPVVGNIYPHALVVDSAAGGINGGVPEIWITGSFDGASVTGIGAGVLGELTPFLIAVTPTFTNVFQRTFPGAVANTSASGFIDLDVSPTADKIYVSGRFDSSTNFGSGLRNPTGIWDGYVIAYERSSGAPAWEQLISVAGATTVMGGVVADADGWVISVGETTSNVVVNQSLGRILPKSPGAGSTEAFLVVYKPDGTW
ncbi:MAG: hypothetical protein GEEBNDBF_01605 [bacterium]|nr:hypothetical protein [bacterium]